VYLNGLGIIWYLAVYRRFSPFIDSHPKYNQRRIELLTEEFNKSK